jgi:hypothetical protein
MTTAWGALWWWITAESAAEIISAFAEADLSPIGHAGGTRECPVDTGRVELRLVAHAVGHLWHMG